MTGNFHPSSEDVDKDDADIDNSSEDLDDIITDEENENPASQVGRVKFQVQSAVSLGHNLKKEETKSIVSSNKEYTN